MKRLLFLCFVALALNCSTTEKENSKYFILTGKVKDLDNGELLYLTEAFTHRILDSVIIKDNSFQFNTKLPYEPINSLIRTRYFDYYKFVWLENSKMILDGSASGFNEATISGSKTQILSENLRKDLNGKHYSERETFEKEFIADNPNNPLSAQLLSIYTKKWGNDVTSQLYEKLSYECKSTHYGRLVSSFLNLEDDKKGFTNSYK